jgi:hypothetical protein
MLENMLKISNQSSGLTALPSSHEHLSSNSMLSPDYLNDSIELRASSEESGGHEPILPDGIFVGNWNDNAEEKHLNLSANDYTFFEWPPSTGNEGFAEEHANAPNQVSETPREAVASRDSTDIWKRRKPSFNLKRTNSLSSSNFPSPQSSQNCDDLPDAVVDYLLDKYFGQFQTLLKIVHEQTFREQKIARSGPAYRESLLLAMLAAGARFCDDQSITKDYTHRNGETVFARRSKVLMESEVQNADLTTVQALVILGELETSAGNEMSGCMYAGMLN